MHIKQITVAFTALMAGASALAIAPPPADTGLGRRDMVDSPPLARVAARADALHRFVAEAQLGKRDDGDALALGKHVARAGALDHFLAAHDLDKRVAAGEVTRRQSQFCSNDPGQDEYCTYCEIYFMEECCNTMDMNTQEITSDSCT